MFRRHGFKWIGVLFVSVLLLALGSCATAPPDESVGRFLQRIESEDADVRCATWQEAGRMDARAVAPLAELMCGEDREVARAAQHALTTLVVAHTRRPAHDLRRQAVTTAVAKVACGEYPFQVQREGIHLLSLIGGASAIEPLGGLLTDPDLNDEARMALQRIPGPRATGTLIEGLSRVDEPMRLRLIEALGRRRATAAVPILTDLAAQGSVDVAAAAMTALARIGEEVESLFAPERIARLTYGDLARLGDAYLVYAERMNAAEQRETARAIYDALMAKDLPEHLRCAAILGLGRTGDASDAVTMLPWLADESPAMAQAAAEGLVRLRDRPKKTWRSSWQKEPTEAKVSKVDTKLVRMFRFAEPIKKAGLLHVLVRRRVPELNELLAEAIEAKAANVRETGFVILAELHRPDPTWESAMLEAAEEDEDESVRAAALTGYLEVAGLRIARGDEVSARAMYLRALELTESPAHRIEALRGLAWLADDDAVPALEPLLKAEGLVAEEAALALVAIAEQMLDESRTERALALLARVTAEVPTPRVAQAVQAVRAEHALEPWPNQP